MHSVFVGLFFCDRFLSTFQSYFSMSPDASPTYAEVYTQSLPVSDKVRRFCSLIGSLDQLKFNLIPYWFNRVDVALEFILPRRHRHWKCYLWLVVFTRRFCNNASLLLAVVHYLHLRRFSASVSEDLNDTKLVFSIQRLVMF